MSTGSVMLAVGSYECVSDLLEINRYYGTVSDSFWDTENSGQAISAAGTGKTTEEMIYFDTFDGVGWDITTVNLGETNPVTPGISLKTYIPLCSCTTKDGVQYIITIH